MAAGGTLSPGFSGAGGGGQSVLRLVRQDFHRPAWQANHTNLLTNGGPSLVGPHKCSISCTEQKLRIDQGTQKRITGGTIEAPQPLRLRRCQAKSRHLDVLTLDTPQHVIMRLLRCHIRSYSQGFQ